MQCWAVAPATLTAVSALVVFQAISKTLRRFWAASSGCEGQNAFGARPSSCYLIFEELADLYRGVVLGLLVDLDLPVGSWASDMQPPALTARLTFGKHSAAERGGQSALLEPHVADKCQSCPRSL